MGKCVKCGKRLEGPVELICSDCVVAENVTSDTSEYKEEVNHPARYGGDTTYECIKVLKNWYSREEYRGFLKCNSIKYLCRLGKKDEAIQELKKAQ